MEAIDVGEKEKSSQALIRVEWRAAGLSCLPLVDAERGAWRAKRERLKDLRARLEDTLGGLVERARAAQLPEILEARGELLAIRRELELFATCLRAEARRRRISRGLMLLAPVLIGGLCAFYLRADRGLRLERIEGLRPAAAYRPLSQDTGALTVREDYLQAFLAEFSKSYFAHPSHFDALYYDLGDSGKPTKQHSLQHKVSLRNASHGEVMYLSSIDAVVDVIGKSEFPWSRLTVTPQVTAAFEVPGQPRSLRVKSDGVGPALEVVETLTTASGLVLSMSKLPIFHRDEMAPFTTLVVDSVAVDRASGALAAPRYLRLSARPEAPGSHYFEVTAPRSRATPAAGACKPNTDSAAFGFYEEIRTMARLRQLTRTAYAEPLQLEVRYSSLDGKAGSQSLRGMLADSEIFYAGLSGLQSDDPRCEAPGEGVRVRDAIPDELDQLAMLFVPDKELTQPKGTDLITARLGVDLLDAEPGGCSVANQPLDGFLNPQGVLSIQLTLNAPSSLHYGVRILVNGQQAASYQFAGMVPEFMSFAAEGPERAVRRLRKVFGR
jgi:hypothetical protein